MVSACETTVDRLGILIYPSLQCADDATPIPIAAAAVEPTHVSDICDFESKLTTYMMMMLLLLLDVELSDCDGDCWFV